MHLPQGATTLKVLRSELSCAQRLCDSMASCLPHNLSYRSAGWACFCMHLNAPPPGRNNLKSSQIGAFVCPASVRFNGVLPAPQFKLPISWVGMFLHAS